VRFLGNVAVGRDVNIGDLTALYDAVVVAVGAGEDRRLGIPGEDLSGVYGSCAFVGWYNGHPDHRDLAPRLGTNVVVIGNGNVAIDVVRVLAKTPAEMATSDLCRHAAEAIAAAPLAALHLVGRRGPVEAAFTPAELAELGRLERCRPVVDAAVLPGGVGDLDGPERAYKEKNLEILRSFAEPDEETIGKPLPLDFVFHARPVAILGNGKVESVRFERTLVRDGIAAGAGETFEIAADTMVTAIGYTMAALDGVPMDANRGVIANRDGVIEPGLYAVGWSKRGPSGTIPTNRADSIAVVERMLGDLKPASKSGRDGLDALLRQRGSRVVSLADWHRIEAAEAARADGEHPREKFTRIEEMLAVLED